MLHTASYDSSHASARFLVIVSWLVAVSFSLRFLKSVVSATGGTQNGPLTIWSVVFLLVTLQMTTTLRPILGRSDDFLSQEKKFFLQHWGGKLWEIAAKTANRADQEVIS